MSVTSIDNPRVAGSSPACSLGCSSSDDRAGAPQGASHLLSVTLLDIMCGQQPFF